MKNWLIGILVCVAAGLFFGVTPLQRALNEAIRKGTLKGAETCMAYSASELLSKDSVKAACILKFQAPLYRDEHATGKAGPRWRQNKVQWSGTLENKTHDHVTTWIEVVVSIHDEDGTTKDVKVDTPIWIDPLDLADFTVDLPELEPESLRELEFCSRDEETPKNCMSWGVTALKGLRL